MHKKTTAAQLVKSVPQHFAFIFIKV